MATPHPRKSKSKTIARKSSDSDVEMFDSPRAATKLETSKGNTTLYSPKLDAPERRWTGQIKDDMFNFPDSSDRSGSASPKPASPKEDNLNLDGPKTTPGAGGSRQNSDNHQHKARTAVKGIQESFIPAPGAAGGATNVNAAEAIQEDLQTLDAVRVSLGFIEAHLSDLMWMQDRLVEHHGNMVRTRNLAQKALEGISRAVYMKERLDEVHDATVEREK